MNQPTLFDQPIYYNTTSLKNEELVESIESCKHQDDVVLELYKKYINMSPSQCLRRINKDWPITSIRRSINTLTERGLLVKSDVKVKGLYGKAEHVWSKK